MTTYKVGYFIGSLVAACINRQLAKALIKLAPAELTFTEIPIKNLPHYSYDFSHGITPCLYIHCSKEPLWPAAASLPCLSAVPWLWAPPRSHPCAASTSRTTVRPMS